ncbi:MAG: exo-alpha-sialidase, partial [Chloroflexi bacterium]|nr:exo-alpha-sialidase [Chloroflexota bacterium]
MRRLKLLLLAASVLLLLPGEQTSRLARADAAPTFHPIDLSFIGPSHGWVLGSLDLEDGSTQVALRRTSDSGKTWEVLPALAPAVAPGPVSQAAAPPAASLRFATLNDGWAFGPGLFVTHDGGSRWSEVQRSGEVIALEVVGRSVWTLQRACVAAAACVPTFLTSEDSGATWQSVATQPPIPSRADLRTQLLRLTPRDARLLSYWTDGSAPFGQLLATDDGGASWETLDQPCGLRRFQRLEQLDAPNESELWLLCAGTYGATAMMDTLLYVSEDGGRTWLVRAAEVKPGAPPNPETSLPTVGSPVNLEVVSSDRAFVSLRRNTLYRTQDGGLTWSPAIDLSLANPEDGGVGPVRFVDSQHGWVLYQH